MYRPGKIYFFRRDRYNRYDVGNDMVDVNESIGINWPKLSEAGFLTDIDAALNWGNGKVYFFKGDMYCQYDIREEKVDYTAAISRDWPGLFTSDIDAAVNWGNGKVYFFKGRNYCRYDIASNMVDVAAPITQYWPNLSTAGFSEDIDAALNWGNGKVYFFKGDQYCRYDIETETVDHIASISQHWDGLFAGDIDAAVDWRLGFVTRGQWGAVAPRSSNAVALAQRTEFVVHYSTGEELGVEDTTTWVKNIQHYHMNLRSQDGGVNFDDIGYNYLVDIYGNVFEGRGRDVQGAHCTGHNTSGIGVCFLGDDDPAYEDATPQAKWAIRQLWKAFSRDAGRQLTVYGHRDLAATLCPGDELLAWVHQGMPVAT